MTMDNPEIFYRSAPQTDAAPVSDKRVFFPIPQISPLCAAWKQDFQQLRANFVALAFNTPHPDDPSFYLQNENETSDSGALITKWTRSYYQIPPSWDDYETISFTFPKTPGYLVLVSGQSGLIGRDPYTPPNGVVARNHRDYFMVGAGRPYVTAANIPLIPVQAFVGKLNPQFYTSPPQVVDNIDGNGGTTIGTTQYFETVPNKTTYFGWVSNAAAYGWSSGYDDGSGKWQATGQPAVINPGQIVISCKLERLMGNIWARTTSYVLAQ